MKGMRLSATRMSDASSLSSRYFTRFRPTNPMPPAISHLGLPETDDAGGAAIAATPTMGTADCGWVGGGL